jgi:hypothetical protein
LFDVNNGAVGSVGCFGVKESDSLRINLFFVGCIGTRNIFGGNVCLKRFATVGKIIDPNWGGMTGEAFLKKAIVSPTKLTTLANFPKILGSLAG